MANTSSEEEIQENILDYLEMTLAQPIIEQAIPDSKTVLRNKQGQVEPYVAIQFGDLQEGYSHSMVGPVGDDYWLPIYGQAIAPEARSARRIANRLRKALLGLNFEWSGPVRKRPGGGMFPMVTSNAATEAYVFPASFRIPIQYVDLDVP